MREFEGEDQRIAKYSNIQHPFFLKPESIMSLVATAVGTGIGVTLWITSEITMVDQLARGTANDVKHIKEYQLEKNDSIEKSINALKEQQVLSDREGRDQFDKLDRKLDKLIERELNRGYPK